jgi:membrane-associated protein
MLFGVSITDAINAIGVIGIMAIIFAESGLMVGFILPGDSLLFPVGFLAQQGVLDINIHLLVFLLFLAAVAGDQLGYWFGRKVGRKLFTKKDSILFHHSYLERAEHFYEKYGVATIVISRFLPVVRSFAPVVAGIGHMPYRTYLLFDIIGGALWVGSITYLGYFGGAFLESHGINVEALVMPIVLVAIVVSAGSPLIHILKDPKSRKAMLRRFGIKKSEKTN